MGGQQDQSNQVASRFQFLEEEGALSLPLRHLRKLLLSAWAVDSFE